MDENFDVKAMVHEASENYKRQGDSIESIKTHARTVFSSSSIIISLLSLFQILSKTPKGYNVNVSYGRIIAVIVVLYVSLVVISLLVLSPLLFHGPIKMDWGVITETFKEKSERDVLLMQLSAYINAFEKNKLIIKNQRLMIIIQSIIFALIVLFVLLAGMLPYI